MGKNKTKVTGFRIEDTTILEKLNIIAEKNYRTRNKEVEYALKIYVEQYEKEHGPIPLEDENTEPTKLTKAPIGNITQKGHNNSIKINNVANIRENSGTINM